RGDRPEREADRVDVVVGEPDVHRHRADDVLDPPVAAEPGVDAPAAARTHQRDETVEVASVRPVYDLLGVDEVRAALVVSPALDPGGREHADAEPDGHGGQRDGIPTAHAALHEAGRRPHQPREPDTGEQDAGQMDADDEAVDLNVAEAGKDVDQPVPGAAAE